MMDRTGFIGGSDAAALLGLSRWSTPLKLWAEKTGNIAIEEKDSEAIELGRELENYVAKRFTKKTGKKVIQPKEVRIHPKYPFIKAQIDRLVVGEDAVLECKTCSAWKYKEWEGDEIPQEYIIQVMHQLAVTGKKIGYIAVLIGNQDFKWKEIKRDEKLINQIISREVDFWNNFVLPNVMPTVVSCKDSDTLYSLFEKEVPASILALGDDANNLADDITALEEDALSLEGSIEQKKNELKLMLGTNETGISSKYKITWKEQTVKRVDTKTLKEANLFEQFSKESKTRVLRIVENKGDK
jgi:putative phage-type endonuclease